MPRDRVSDDADQAVATGQSASPPELSRQATVPETLLVDPKNRDLYICRQER